jgi:hypothetical protein
MHMTLEQVEAEMLKLPRSARARLAKTLLCSLDEDSDIELAWEDEAERRHQRYLAGEELAVTVAEAFAQLRSELKK